MVAQNYQPPADFEPNFINPLMSGDFSALNELQLDPKSRCIVPFMACGDLDGWDSDRSYSLDENYKYTEPVRPPTEPAYKEALDKKRKGQI